MSDRMKMKAIVAIAVVAVLLIGGAAAVFIALGNSGDHHSRIAISW